MLALNYYSQMFWHFIRQKCSLQKCFALCKDTVKQYCETWKAARKYRITGSVCYSLFTYSMHPINSQIGMIRCIRCHPNLEVIKQLILEMLKRMLPNVCMSTMNNVVCKVGIVVLPELPWFGYSPDGVVFDNGKLSKLIENRRYHLLPIRL